MGGLLTVAAHTGFGGPVRIGDVVVNQGDWVVADELGAAVCPHRHVDQVIALGLDKRRGESTVRSELSRGADVGDVFIATGSSDPRTI